MEKPRKNKWRDSTFYNCWGGEQYEAFKQARDELCTNFFADYEDEDIGHILRMGGIRMYKQLPEEVKKRVPREDIIRLYQELGERVDGDERDVQYELYRVGRDDSPCSDETDCIERDIWEEMQKLERDGVLPRSEVVNPDRLSVKDIENIL